MSLSVITPVTVGAVAFGGALGSVVRFVVGAAVPSWNGVPIATLTVNVSGALLIGALAKLFAGSVEPSMWRLALATGFCGGFTTFSALSLEVISLLQQGRVLRAAAYVLLTLVLGFAATWLGYTMAPSRYA